jgi:hypothetical protein
MNAENKSQSYPSIEECVEVIAAKSHGSVHLVAAALLSMAREMNMDVEELVHIQYRTAAGQNGFDPDIFKKGGACKHTD